jgi:hypothetical protein
MIQVICLRWKLPLFHLLAYLKWKLPGLLSYQARWAFGLTAKFVNLKEIGL